MRYKDILKLYIHFRSIRGPNLKTGIIRTRTRRRVKTLQPTLGWSELPKSSPSTMNFYMVYFSLIPQNNARLKLSCKFGESKCKPYWIITSMTSHGMHYVLNEHLDFSQHGPYAIPSEIILWYSYSASFNDQTETLIDLLHKWIHLTLIISLTIIKIFANMAKMQYHPR